MKLARYIFGIAGIYGLIVLIPQYFLEEKNGVDFPPAITHPEYYYGFIGVALAFQVLFLIIAKNPAGYRTAMIPSILEKFSFGLAVTVLFLQHRIQAAMFAAGIIDLFLGLLFIVAYLKTSGKQ